MGSAHGSEWMARLHVGLAAVALIAACRRGEPTTTSGPPANVPGPDAAEPRWSVEIVERPPLATYPDLDIRAVYPDGDVLVVPPEERTAQMALERRGPGGVLRWRTAWKDHRDFHVAVTARDTWVLAIGERPLRVSPRTQLAIDDPGPNPLVLARFRSADGVIEATTVLVPHVPFEDRRQGLVSAFLVPHDDGVIVSAPGPGIDPLRKFNHDLALVVAVPMPAGEFGDRSLVGIEATTANDVCLRFRANSDPPQDDESMLCLDARLTRARVVRYPEGADEIWHHGPHVVGTVTKTPLTGYRLDIKLPTTQVLAVESQCRWKDRGSFWDSVLPCDDHCPPPPCRDTMVTVEGMDTHGTSADIAFSVYGDIWVASRPIAITGHTLAVLSLPPDQRARLQLYPGCHHARFVAEGRLLVHCGSSARLISTR